MLLKTLMILWSGCSSGCLLHGAVEGAHKHIDTEQTDLTPFMSMIMLLIYSRVHANTVFVANTQQTVALEMIIDLEHQYVTMPFNPFWCSCCCRQ